MRLYTFPLLALFALGARAASLPRHAVAVTDLEKKLTRVVEEVLKKDVQVENNASDQELIEEVNEVPDVGNQLKKVPGIPVKVIAEEGKPSLKKDWGIEKGDGISDSIAAANIKREEVDLKNPGEPQRQEHDTQSPEETNSEQETISAIKQSFIETQNVFKQGFDGLATKFQEAFQANDQLVTIQKSLEKLQKSFSRQFEQINDTLQGYLSAEKPAGESNSDKGAAIVEMEKKLEVLQEKVESDVKSLTKVIPEVASVRDDSSSSSSSSSSASSGGSEGSGIPGGSGGSGGSGGGSGPFASFQEYMTTFQTNVQQALSGFQNNMQNYVSQLQQGGGSNASAAGPGSIIQNFGGQLGLIGQQNQIDQGASSQTSQQSDETATQRPTIWESIQSSYQNIFRPGQQQQQQSQQTQENVQADTPAAPSTAAPNRPIVQAIQNNPIYQGVVNLIRPTTKAPVVAEVITEQAAAPEKPAEPIPEGSNAVPAADKPIAAKPEKDDKTPTQTIAPAVGPIQQIVQRNPIVQGITSAVQRIQNSIGGNTDKPRELELRGHGGGQGDNNNVDGVEAGKNEPIAEEQKEEEKPQQKEDKEISQEPIKTEVVGQEQEIAVKEGVKEEATPSELPAKTE